jgi:ABC-type Na+ efflux pump permease subunit
VLASVACSSNNKSRGSGRLSWQTAATPTTTTTTANADKTKLDRMADFGRNRTASGRQLMAMMMAMMMMMMMMMMIMIMAAVVVVENCTARYVLFVQK